VERRSARLAERKSAVLRLFFFGPCLFLVRQWEASTVLLGCCEPYELEIRVPSCAPAQPSLLHALPNARTLRRSPPMTSSLVYRAREAQRRVTRWTKEEMPRHQSGLPAGPPLRAYHDCQPGDPTAELPLISRSRYPLPSCAGRRSPAMFGLTGASIRHVPDGSGVAERQAGRASRAWAHLGPARPVRGLRGLPARSCGPDTR